MIVFCLDLHSIAKFSLPVALYGISDRPVLSVELPIQQILVIKALWPLLRKLCALVAVTFISIVVDNQGMTSQRNEPYYIIICSIFNLLNSISARGTSRGEDELQVHNVVEIVQPPDQNLHAAITSR